MVAAPQPDRWWLAIAMDFPAPAPPIGVRLLHHDMVSICHRTNGRFFGRHDITFKNQDLQCDVLRHVPGPAFRGIEGDDAESVAVLAGQKIADDGFAVGLGGIGLVKGDAELTMVVQDRYKVTSSKGSDS
jgi:hypothetical protein